MERVKKALLCASEGMRSAFVVMPQVDYIIPKRDAMRADFAAIRRHAKSVSDDWNSAIEPTCKHYDQ